MGPGGLISYELQTECQRMGKLPDCSVTFDQKNDVLVVRFGRFGRGQIEPNPDISGIGVRFLSPYSLLRDMLITRVMKVLIGLAPNFLLCLFAIWVVSVEVVRGSCGKR